MTDKPHDDVIIAEVAVEKTALHFDKLYSYIIPEMLVRSAQVGCRVIVPFGNVKRRQGIITAIQNESGEVKGLKNIGELIDSEPVLSAEMLSMAKFMKERYYCTLYEACAAMLPAGLGMKLTFSYTYTQEGAEKTDLPPEERRVIDFLIARRKPVRHDILIKNMGLADDGILTKLCRLGLLRRTEAVKKRLADASVKMIRICCDADIPAKLSPKQSELLSLLQSIGECSVKELCYFTGVTASVADALVKKGICEYFEEEAPRYIIPKAQAQDRIKEITLTEEQQRAYEELRERQNSGKPSVSLLYGITGSGKTSVFMKLIDDAINNANGGIIVMVPEISLTPQLLDKFTSRYGGRIAVFHSGLSIGKRLEEWKRIKSGEAEIAVGTRSAIFAPFERLSLIVMDEEQEYTYKSGATPRFHARDLAKFRCAKNNCLLLLSSATPSVESFYFANNGRYGLQILKNRYGSAKLPEVITVDMNLEQEQGNMSAYSSVLLESIEANLREKKQSIILLNRRGHNTFVSCRSCKEVISCPNCSISLTYHSANNRLMCHYCGYSVPVPKTCPACGSEKLRFGGTGTQRAEEELSELFPSARVLRLDADSTMRRYAYEKKLSQFADGEYDILLGTQMVAKGLDFKNVTLVGVINADQMLYVGDFRGYERAFSLLTQVVGRSGRGDKEGKAIIQTFCPENPVIALAAAQDYDKFYNSEIMLRKSMIYPPFSDICVVAFIGTDRALVEKAAVYFSELLRKKVSEEFKNIPLVVLGPAPALVSRISNKYRYRLILKFRNNKAFRELMSSLLCEIGADRSCSEVTAFADINPESIM